MEKLKSPKVIAAAVALVLAILAAYGLDLSALLTLAQ